MKKSLFILIGIILGLGIGFSTALAQATPAPGQSQDRVKVYLSEPIGAGIDVFIINRCHKVQQRASLQCDADNAEVFAEQCKKTENNITKTLYGKRIQICEHRDDETRIDESGAECAKESSDYILKNQQGYVWKIGICPAEKICAGDGKNSEYILKETIISVNNSEPTIDFKLRTDKRIQKISEKYQQEVNAQRLVVLQVHTVDVCDTRELTPQGQVLSEPTNPLLDGTIPPSCEITNIPKEVVEECKNAYTDLIGSPEIIKECSFTCKKAERISGKSGTDLISRYIAVVYKGMAAIVGIIAVLNMVYRGIRISMGGSQAEEIEAAKKSIFMSIAGLALLFLSGIILYAINPNFFV